MDLSAKKNKKRKTDYIQDEIINLIYPNFINSILLILLIENPWSV